MLRDPSMVPSPAAGALRAASRSPPGLGGVPPDRLGLTGARHVGRPPSRFSGQTRELGSAQRQTGQGLESSVTLRSRQHVRSASHERASMKYRIGCITEMRLPIGGFYGTAVRGGLSSDEAARRGKSLLPRHAARLLGGGPGCTSICLSCPAWWAVGSIADFDRCFPEVRRPQLGGLAAPLRSDGVVSFGAAT